MKLKVFSETKKPEEEKKVYLMLSDNEDGTILLSAVDGNGINLHRGNILTIFPNGIYRHTGLSSEIGFKREHGISRIDMISENIIDE